MAFFKWCLRSLVVQQAVGRLCGVTLLLMLLAACGGAAPLTQRTASYTVTLAFDKLAVGDRTATVTITDQSNQTVSASKITLTATMLTMGMASPEVVAQPGSNGRYTGEKVLLSMAGDWELDVKIQTGAAIETARFLFTVPTP